MTDEQLVAAALGKAISASKGRGPCVRLIRNPKTLHEADKEKRPEGR